jgi:hypothetical protein
MMEETEIGFPFIKGMTYGFLSNKGDWSNTKAFESFDIMKDSLNINTVILPVVAWQNNSQSTIIDFSGNLTVSDWEITHMIDYAHKKGLRVILKPMISLLDNSGRAYINFFDNDVPFEPSWNDWFRNYSKFILHMAKIAAETDCSILSVGCGLVQSERRENQWRELIADVRKVFSGFITYNSDKFQEDKIKWWDAVDVISASGYYAPEDFAPQLERIKTVVSSYKKPSLFLEAGCPSRAGASSCPNNLAHTGPANVREQAEYYKKLFSITKNLSWFYGFGLWNWPLDIYSKANADFDDTFCVYGKEAQNIIRIAYA